MLDKNIVRVAVPVPLRRCFDYRLPEDISARTLKPGMRLWVPFGRSQVMGIVDEVGVEPSIAPGKIKAAIKTLDETPILNKPLVWLCRWASQYYHHPLGEVYHSALPVYFRQDKDVVLKESRVWQLTEQGLQVDQLPKNAVRQTELLQYLREYPLGQSDEQLKQALGQYKSSLKSMENKGWVQQIVVKDDVDESGLESALDLNKAQEVAVEEICRYQDEFTAFLLYGVTGSGKTEVYLQVIQAVLTAGKQVLILVPEIGLTPQLLQRFSRRFAVPITVFHSGLSNGGRAQNWLQASTGRARIIIGTRSAVFACLQNPGLIIVDEEHDVSFKQQDGFRYSARDLAIVRARHEKIPIVLGSATPSLESMVNADEGRYTLLDLPERAGDAVHPDMHLIDLRHQKLDEGLSPVLIKHIHQHIEREGQVLLFLNRRGYAPTLLCHDCGWVGNCQRCDAHMTLHHASGQLRCHHCGTERRVDRHCPDCGSVDLRPIGQGTERTEEALKRHFPDVRIARIDRDTTRRKGEMERKLKQAESGEDQILLGTQLLAKGHHFPNVTLVAILDSDQGLFSADFRGGERMSQLILQVAGRAGRAEKSGEVLIQTHHPDHALLQYAIKQDYRVLTRALLEERQLVQWPPYSHLALLRAESTQRNKPMQFLREAAEKARLLSSNSQLMLLGPVPAPMEKRAGRYRAQLLLQAGERADLHNLLSCWLNEVEALKSSSTVRWSLDVDPQDMF
ncbi:MAG: primosomal protein N' [Gammaproteobacteria bacterium]|nr:primosomal protein N' [Gammaproteobacteria bacterium]